MESGLAYYVDISLQNRQRFADNAVGLASMCHVGVVAVWVVKVGGPESVRSVEPKDQTGNRLLYGVCMRFACV